MKNITIISPNYHPETNAAAKRSTALAEFLAANQWKVTVITNLPHYPQNELYKGYESVKSLKLEKGVKVLRLRPWIVSKKSLPLRLLSEITFGLKAIKAFLSYSSSILFTTSPYMFLGPMGLIIGRLRKVKVVWEIRDLTWQYARATGKRTFGLDKLIEGIMQWVVSKLDGLVTVTEGILNNFDNLPNHHIVIPNGVTDEFMFSLEKALANNKTQAKTITVLYAGLLGFPQGLSTLIQAAKLLPKVQFRLVGDGAEKKLLEDLAQELSLNNVIFTGYVSSEEVLHNYAQADILVALLRHNPAFEIAQPSKLWEYMSTGKPVIFCGKGEAAHIIDQHKTGLSVIPENPEALARAIQKLIDQPKLAESYGKNGKRFIQEYRCRQSLTNKLKVFLEQIEKE